MEQRIIRNKEHWVVDEDGNVLGFDHGTRTQYLTTVETNPLTGEIVFSAGNDDPLQANGIAASRNLREFNEQVAGVLEWASTAGEMVCDFKDTVWTQTVGTATTLDPNWTGYDANGNVTGITSRTGMPYILKWTPAGSSERIRSPIATLLNKSLKGSKPTARIGVWVYLENEQGFEAGGTVSNHTLTLELSTRNTTGTEGGQQYSVAYNFNQMKEGWNFLQFVCKGGTDMSQESSAGTTPGTDPHPLGIISGPYGDGSNGNINAANLQWIAITLNGALWAGSTVYLDSIWTGFEPQTTVTFGCDQATSDLQTAIDTASTYGWKLYAMAPRGVWTSGTVIGGDYADTTYNYPMLDAAYAAGWDVVNHTMTHRSLGALTNAAEVKYEVMRAEGWMAAQGYTRGRGFYASPNSSTSRLAEKVIKNCGFKWQRHARGYINPVTPWGLANPHHQGAIDMGNQTNWQSSSRIKNAIDHAIRYGGCLNLFWHFIRTAGDDGSGVGIYTTDNLNIYRSNWLEVARYLKEREDAGDLRVITPGQLIYGYGVQA